MEPYGNNPIYIETDLQGTTVRSSESFKERFQYPDEEVFRVQEFRDLLSNINSLLSQKKSKSNDFNLNSFQMELPIHSGEKSIYKIQFLPALSGGYVTILFSLNALADQKELENQIEAISEYSNVIFHDLSNLMQPVLILGDLIKMELDAKEKKIPELEKLSNYFKKLKDSISGIKKLITNFDIFSNKNRPSRENINLSIFIKEYFEKHFESEWERSNFLFSGLNSDSKVFMERSVLEKILYEIIQNSLEATKATQTPQIRIELKDEIQIENQDFFHLDISDNGVGIPQSFQRKVFTPFFKLDKKSPNHGLGLTRVLSWMHRSRGKMSIQSREGESTCVSLFFPIGQA